MMKVLWLLFGWIAEMKGISLILWFGLLALISWLDLLALVAHPALVELFVIDDLISGTRRTCYLICAAGRFMKEVGLQVILCLLWLAVLVLGVDWGCMWIRLVVLALPLVILIISDLVRKRSGLLILLICPAWLLNTVDILFQREKSQTVEQYKHSGHPFVETFHFHDKNENAVICTPAGADVWIGFLDCVISAYQNNRSWKGSFDLQQLRITNSKCNIEILPLFPASYANLVLDLSKLAKLLLKFYSNTEGEALYIKELHDSMHSPPSGVASNQKMERFLRFLRNHPAVKTSGKRKGLVFDIFEAYDAMDKPESTNFCGYFNQMQNQVDSMAVGGWRTVAQGNALMSAVLNYKPQGGKKRTDKPSAFQLFRFVRNFEVHASSNIHTLVNGQLIDLMEIELIVAKNFSAFLACALCEVMMETEITEMKGLLLNAWRNYR